MARFYFNPNLSLSFFYLFIYLSTTCQHTQQQQQHTQMKVVQHNPSSLYKDDYNFIEGIQFVPLAGPTIQKLAQNRVLTEPNQISSNDFGALTFNDQCATCKQRINNCYGHTGVVNFNIPIYSEKYFFYCKELLEVLCVRCGHLVFDLTDELRDFMKNEMSIYKMCKDRGMCRKIRINCMNKWKRICKQMDTLKTSCVHCSSPFPTSVNKKQIANTKLISTEGLITPLRNVHTLYIYWKQKKEQTGSTTATGTKLSDYKFDLMRDVKKQKTVTIEHWSALEFKRLLQKIPDETLKLLGLYTTDPDNHVSNWLVNSCLVFPPNSLHAKRRSAPTSDEIHPFTAHLKNIIKNNKELYNNIEVTRSMYNNYKIAKKVYNANVTRIILKMFFRSYLLRIRDPQNEVLKQFNVETLIRVGYKKQRVALLKMEAEYQELKEKRWMCLYRLQFAVMRYICRDPKKGSSPDNDGYRNMVDPEGSLKADLSGKKGLFRSGKKTTGCARVVASPNSEIGIGDIIIPTHVANNQGMYFEITNENIDHYNKLLEYQEDIHNASAGKRCINLNPKSVIRSKHGQIIKVHIKDTKRARYSRSPTTVSKNEFIKISNEYTVQYMIERHKKLKIGKKKKTFNNNNNNNK